MKEIDYVTHALMQSPVGTISVACTEHGVFSVDFDEGERLRQRERNGECSLSDMRMPFSVLEELTAYFEGELHEFTVPLDLRGTPFQKLVWEQLLKIPFGETMTYGDIARNLNNEKAYRAVGHANSQNPVAVIVPCHRVVSRGGLGGYAGGIEVKEWLLGFERKCINEQLQSIAMNLMEMIEERLDQLGFTTVPEEPQKIDKKIKKKNGKVLSIADYLKR